MSTDTWGVERSRKPASAEPQRKRGKRPALTPQAAHAAHKGIVWLHASAIAVWLLVALVFGALLLAGKHVPVVLVLAACGAALGHAIFLTTHLLLGRKAKRRATA
jgi:hypothetical protein